MSPIVKLGCILFSLSKHECCCVFSAACNYFSVSLWIMCLYGNLAVGYCFRVVIDNDACEDATVIQACSLSHRN